MANKRKLKKAIRVACGDMAGECIITRNFVPGVDTKKMEDIIFEIADLQFSTLENVSFGFDKGKRSFEDAHQYKQARAKYFSKAYKKLIADFSKGVNDIVAQMNEALPQAQKDLNKANAAK